MYEFSADIVAVLDGTVEDKAVQDNIIQEGAGQSSADSEVLTYGVVLQVEVLQGSGSPEGL